MGRKWGTLMQWKIDSYCGTPEEYAQLVDALITRGKYMRDSWVISTVRVRGKSFCPDNTLYILFGAQDDTRYSQHDFIHKYFSVEGFLNIMEQEVQQILRKRAFAFDKNNEILLKDKFEQLKRALLNGSQMT